MIEFVSRTACRAVDQPDLAQQDECDPPAVGRQLGNELGALGDAHHECLEGRRAVSEVALADLRVRGRAARKDDGQDQGSRCAETQSHGSWVHTRGQNVRQGGRPAGEAGREEHDTGF